MKCKKPLTDKIKERANALYKFLLTKQDFVTKYEIGAYLGVKNERTVRDIISVLATKKPIISNSTGAGYKLARSVEDIEEAKHTWKELDSRIEELNKRKKPLIEFCESVNGNIVF